jgi:hypothetical protein
VPGQLHPNSFGDGGPHQASHGRAPQIVRDAPRATSSTARRLAAS